MAFNYYPATITNTEIDIRSELDRLLNGDPNLPYMIPHGQWVILRKLKRDELGKPIKSSEVDPITKEPDMIYKSDNVTKTGYLYDDHLTKAYLMDIRLSSLTEEQTKPGIVNDNLRVGYFDYKSRPEKHDIVLVPYVNDDGEIITPLQIRFEFYISTVLPAVSDGSRLEFLRCILETQR